MGWHYIPPGMFPFTFHDVHKQAEWEPTQLKVSSSRGDLLGTASEFRRFRWCLRQANNDIGAMQRERTLTYRATIHNVHDGTFALIVTTKPKVMHLILALNPDLTID